MSSDFQKIKESIHADASAEPDLIYILDEGDDFIEYEDAAYPERLCRYEDGFDNPEWIKARILCSPALKDFDVDDIANFVHGYLEKDTYRSLRYLIFIKDDEADFDYFLDKLESITGYSLLEAHCFPAEDQLGISWIADCCSVVHIGNIEKAVDEEIEMCDISASERENEINIGIKTTVAHELRHLMQNDPYRQAEIWFEDDPEEDAEQFARDAVDNYLHQRPVHDLKEVEEPPIDFE